MRFYLVKNKRFCISNYHEQIVQQVVLNCTYFDKDILCRLRGLYRHRLPQNLGEIILIYLRDYLALLEQMRSNNDSK